MPYNMCRPIIKKIAIPIPVSYTHLADHASGRQQREIDVVDSHIHPELVGRDIDRNHRGEIADGLSLIHI